MDQAKYSTLMEALRVIPDPRHARGKRYAWDLLLTLICTALASGQKSAHAMAYWMQLHQSELVGMLQPKRAALPSESTLKRTLRRIDLQLLEQQIARFTEPLVDSHAVLQGQALDGKALRGTCAHGQSVHLLSLVQHGSGLVLAQTQVGQKSNEIKAAPQLLAVRQLRDTVITMDALLAQRALARQIRQQHGHYLMVIKENQAELYHSIALLFDAPPWTKHTQANEYQMYRTVEKGHGRRETRILESSPSLCGYLHWPGLGQVLRRRCERVQLKSGVVSRETRYGITSLKPSQASAAQIEALWRGHWTIENRVHYVRDVTLGEDASQLHTGHAAQALAALRNGMLNLFRSTGWTNIADAIRFYAASIPRALELIGAIPTRL